MSFGEYPVMMSRRGPAPSIGEAIWLFDGTHFPLGAFAMGPAPSKPIRLLAFWSPVIREPPCHRSPAMGTGLPFPMISSERAVAFR
jgi:hypothetical protein